MIKIRPYMSNDSMQLICVINQVCANTPWMATRKFIPTDAWFHAMEIEECPLHRLFVAESKGEIVGWCRSFPAHCEIFPSYVELGIGLLAQYRNKGIGSEMIKRSLEWAEAASKRRVNLKVSSQNYVAIHVFEKNGFEPVDNFEKKKMMMSISLS